MTLSAEEQEAAELQKQKELAQERVDRRARLGHKDVAEPLIDHEPENEE